jgi:diacylglycerol kinase
MWSEQFRVPQGPCGHLFLAVVMGDEGNAQRDGHGRAEAEAPQQESGKIPGAAVLEWFMMRVMEAWRRRFGCAVRGFCETLGREPSMRVHALAALAVVAMAWWLRVSVLEAAVLALAGGLVMAAEVMNTAVERLADRVCRERDEGIRLAKDAAAGAVLVASVAAAMAGLLILGPKLWAVCF